jgi:hypothetical protein
MAIVLVQCRSETHEFLPDFIRTDRHLPHDFIAVRVLHDAERWQCEFYCREQGAERPYRTLQFAHHLTGMPAPLQEIPEDYLTSYGRMRNGRVRFWKQLREMHDNDALAALGSLYYFLYKKNVFSPIVFFKRHFSSHHD